MKRFAIPALIPALLIGFWAFAQKGDSSDKNDNTVLLHIVSDILENGHYSPKQINDEVSSYTFHHFIEQLDYNKQYFLEEDIKALSSYEFLIDDEIKNQDPVFYYKAVEIFNKRLAEMATLYEGLLASSYDFTTDEKLETDPKKRSYFKNEKERNEYWAVYLKYLVFNRYANKLEKQEDDLSKVNQSGDSLKIKTKAELEDEARKQVLKNMQMRFDRRNEMDDEDMFALYINSLNAAFDPNSEYFPPQEKENFDMRMTGRLEGIGAQLTKENEYIKVVSIVPGSASWRQGQLKANDLIVKVAQENQEPVDIIDASMKDAISLIRGPKGTKVILTVQKPDGVTLDIPIERDIVVQEETYAKSAVVNNKQSHNKLGYIYLPSFYSTFGKEEGRKCSDDIKTELERLKGLKVKGIIIDLRNNGGGSLQDAVEMAGLFFSTGPVVQVRDENRPPRVYSDPNSSTTYDGPLVIMINEFSASASEILAAALQDYKRAIIVGTPSFGKGTVQTMIDLNRYVSPEMIPVKPLGSLKFTIQQFYRVNGSSTQFKGVHPDITLPDQYSYIESGMGAYENALPWDSINPVKYTEWAKQKFNYQQLARHSKARVSKNPFFSELMERNDELKADQEITAIGMQIDKELNERKIRKAEFDDFEKLIHANPDLSFESLQVFKPEEESDVKKDKKQRWEKELSEDMYLQETIAILEDLL